MLKALDKIDESLIILDVHFCLLNSEGAVIEIEDNIYHQMSPSLIVVITCPADVIHQRLLSRDKNSFPVDLLEEMQIKEMRKAVRISQQLNIPLVEYKSASDIEEITAVINNLTHKLSL